MNILMVSCANVESSSGETIHTLEMAGGLAGSGARVTLLLRGRYRGSGRPGIKVVGLAAIRNKYLDRLFWPVLVCAVALYVFFRRGCDFVYVRDNIYELPLIFLFRLLGKPVVLEVNTAVAEDLRTRRRARWKIAAAGWAQRRAFLAASLVLPVTSVLAGWLNGQGVPGWKVAVVANGANPYLYRPAERREALAALGLDPSKSYFCFAGNLATWQGGEMVLEVFGRLARKYPGAALMVIGDGEEKGKLEEQARRLRLSGGVLFTGRLPYQRVPVYMAACVAGIGGGWGGNGLPTERRFRYSGSSALKVFSYLACGLPVVIPDIPDLAGTVRRSDCGLVVGAGRLADLEAALRAILEFPWQWREAGQRGRALIEREAAWEHRSARVISLVAQIGHGRKSGSS